MGNKTTAIVLALLPLPRFSTWNWCCNIGTGRHRCVAGFNVCSGIKTDPIHCIIQLAHFDAAPTLHRERLNSSLQSATNKPVQGETHSSACYWSISSTSCGCRRHDCLRNAECGLSLLFAIMLHHLTSCRRCCCFRLVATCHFVVAAHTDNS